MSQAIVRMLVLVGNYTFEFGSMCGIIYISSKRNFAERALSTEKLERERNVILELW